MAPLPQVFAPQPQSRLLSLVGELRNRTYRLAIVKEAGVTVKVKDVTATKGKHIKALSLHNAILWVCKQTRHEASEIYWVENHFTLTEKALQPQPLAVLATAFRPYINKITRLSISHELQPHPAAGGRVCFQVDLDVIRIEGAVTLDGTKPLVEEMTGLFGDESTVCCCEISKLALYNDATDVLEWAGKYAGLLAGRDLSPQSKNAEIWCWTCAGINAW